jgi:hypothetical protein
VRNSGRATLFVFPVNLISVLRLPNKGFCITQLLHCTGN